MSVLIGINVSCDGTIYQLPEQASANGSTVANLVLAVRINENDTEFVDCAFWGKDAQLIMKYPVGHHIMIDLGKLSASAYADKENKPRYRLKINVLAWHSLQSIQSKDENKSVEQASNNASDISDSQKTHDELKAALNFKFSKGKFSGKTIAEILLFEPAYIYNLCTNDSLNTKLKRLCCISYNYWYKKQQQKK